MDQAAFKAELAKPYNQLLMLVHALLALAIIIALLGIGNTLSWETPQNWHSDADKTPQLD